MLLNRSGFPVILLLSVVSVSVFCSKREPKLPEFGRELCAHCSMAIVDKRFHSQLLTEKGRRYYFDSIECSHSFEKSERYSSGSVWFADYENPDRMLSEKAAVLVRSSELRSPMGEGLGAFSSMDRAKNFLNSHKGSVWSRNDEKDY
ncbi:nitrous oxide reductase accessory protein NosL [Leptospira sp. WS58.C1]|uniref:nitrous oxide reductase accessory protein NosL n=1 Tax=Leptospira TaxID=171 RepID=UPI0002BD585E|nr:MULTISPECIES: nitrous oxide reductase accessory protein NosL [unclassified Leptospira]EMK00963.1 accessory protein NosL [Leptospira sp. B5-022]MCR1794207.1 nitrous oxide reductase accessory protein NosL [Leptospira sp. id769339]